MVKCTQGLYKEISLCFRCIVDQIIYDSVDKYHQTNKNAGLGK